MATYKLTYFNAMGRAELARYIFAQAGQQYEDKRVTGEEFAEMKPNLWTGSIPVLEVDGKPLSGSRSIARFLAERFDLAGCNDFENAQLDSIIDVLDDFGQKLIPAFFGKDEEQKAAAKKALFEEFVPKYFGIIEKRITENSCDEGWIFGKKITYVDMRVALTFGGLAKMMPDLANSYPKMKKLSDAVNSQPKIADWIKNRPDTPF